MRLHFLPHRAESQRIDISATRETNAYGVFPENWEDSLLPRSSSVPSRGERLVKGLNHLVAAALDQYPVVRGGRRVVFLASDDDCAAAEIGAPAENLGFAMSR